MKTYCNNNIHLDVSVLELRYFERRLSLAHRPWRSRQLQERYLKSLIDTKQLTGICNLLALRPESVPNILKRRQIQSRTSSIKGGAAS
ncbi:hypothetical protein [Myxosarcina sp. GI1]|uniref:hypothetical protein n=1 Tax=Myxosarcina sp. GI1 TaxID=1541065 RepID=UPI0012E03D26|nr:hypothetical protein [Myxosarcina sp. GI1]